MAKNAIECRGLWKKFTRGQRADSLRDAIPALLAGLRLRRSNEVSDRQFWALQDVSFTVERGGALGVIGANGAGKSTLLKILSRILEADRGTRLIDGRLTAIIEVGAGFHPDLTGRENIYLNGAILGMTRREIKGKISRIIEFAEVQEFIDTPVKRYSSGMQARLGFSIAAHMDPDILLIDEVLAVGDASFQQRCLEKMRYFAQSGRSIVFISHHLQSVAELCSRTMLLIGGRCDFLGSTNQAIARYVASQTRSHTPSQPDRKGIHGVRLLDQRGLDCNRFTGGEPARLSFKVELDRPASRCLLGFGVRRVTDGLVVADYNLHLPVPDAIRGLLPLTIDLDMNLLSGCYAITLFLLDKPTYDKLVYLDFVKVFDVTEPSAYAGLVNFSPRVGCPARQEGQPVGC